MGEARPGEQRDRLRHLATIRGPDGGRVGENVFGDLKRPADHDRAAVVGSTEAPSVDGRGTPGVSWGFMAWERVWMV